MCAVFLNLSLHHMLSSCLYYFFCSSALSSYLKKYILVITFIGGSTFFFFLNELLKFLHQVFCNFYENLYVNLLGVVNFYFRNTL